MVRPELERVLREKKDWDGRADDPNADLERMQGKWETTTLDGKPLPNGERGVKEIRGDKETVTRYGPKGEALESHRVTVTLGRAGPVRTFTFTDWEYLEGPDKGKKLNVVGNYVYVITKDAFYEVLNVRHADRPGPPAIDVWKRVREN